VDSVMDAMALIRMSGTHHGSLFA